MNDPHIPLIRHGLRQMHALLDKAVESMTADQLNFRPREGGVSPFFSLWHYVRTEDNITNYVIQGRATVWLEGGYDRHFGLHRTQQGTGMTEAEANAVMVTDVSRFQWYQQAVWTATDAFLEALDPADLQRPIVIKPVGEQPLWDALWGLCLTHGFRHCGEIEYARGVMGLGGLTI